VLVFHDTSELRRLERLRQEFVANVSHELKTPLASLHEGAGLLQDETLGPLTTQQRKVSSILVDAIDELDGLIDNLLTYAAWRKERRHPTLSWFDAQVFAEEVLTRHQLVLSRRCISTELRVHCERLFGDRSQLRVALENLLSNAIKHAPKETAIDIDVAVSLTHCMLAVRDRGRGVPTPEKRMIFEPFVRGSEAEESEIRGTGIGLSVVHETVLSHNGTVEVEDAEPGARFKMVWPRPADVR
jgi:two-component system sensor histidine kinase GlrK